MSTGEPLSPRTVRGCLAGMGCLFLAVLVEVVVVGLAALRILGFI